MSSKSVIETSIYSLWDSIESLVPSALMICLVNLGNRQPRVDLETGELSWMIAFSSQPTRVLAASYYLCIGSTRIDEVRSHLREVEYGEPRPGIYSQLCERHIGRTKVLLHSTHTCTILCAPYGVIESNRAGKIIVQTWHMKTRFIFQSNFSNTFK